MEIRGRKLSREDWYIFTFIDIYIAITLVCAHTFITIGMVHAVNKQTIAIELYKPWLNVVPVCTLPYLPWMHQMYNDLLSSPAILPNKFYYWNFPVLTFVQARTGLVKIENLMFSRWASKWAVLGFVNWFNWFVNWFNWFNRFVNNCTAHFCTVSLILNRQWILAGIGQARYILRKWEKQPKMGPG